MAVVLKIVVNNGPAFELPLLGKCTLGRSRSCDLMVEDSQMSGKHGSFEVNNKGELIYTDLDSSNGSFLNNSKVQKIQFKINDTLRLGNTLITIDDKKLNNRERMAIGKGIEGEAPTMVVPNLTKSIEYEKAPVKNVAKGKTIKLKKDKMLEDDEIFNQPSNLQLATKKKK